MGGWVIGKYVRKNGWSVSCSCFSFFKNQSFTIAGRRVLSVSCGAQHTVALVQKLRRPMLQRQSVSVASQGSASAVSQGSASAVSQGSTGAESDDLSRSDSPIVGGSQQHR